MVALYQSVLSLGILFYIIVATIGLIALAATYYVYCVPQEKIAAKLGHKSAWMAYVPVARNIQRMKMLGMQMWKLLFVGGIFTGLLVNGLICLITIALIAVGLTTFAVVMLYIMIFANMILTLVCTFEYYFKLASRFGFSPLPSALVWMFIPGVGHVFTYLIALSDRYDGKPISESKKEVVSNGPAGITPVSDAPIGMAGVSGMYAGASFPMKDTDEFVIGRDSALSNIIISANGDKVSRRHCSVKYVTMTGCYEVTDFSSNGTFYGNTRLLKGQPTSIPRGTTIVIGDKINQFKLM